MKQMALALDIRNPVFELIGWPIRIVNTLENRRLSHKKRMQFADIGARTLNDAGIGQAQRFIEVNRPFREK